VTYREVAPAADGQRAGQRERGERGRVVDEPGRRVEPVEVHVQRRTVVQAVQVTAGAAGHHHRVALPAPAVPDAESDRPVAADARRDHRVAQHPVAIEMLEGAGAQLVTGAATDQRYRGAEHPVYPADHLLLVAGLRVGEQQGHPVPGLRQR
jgi:hypothetical protein